MMSESGDLHLTDILLARPSEHHKDVAGLQYLTNNQA